MISSGPPQSSYDEGHDLVEDPRLVGTVTSRAFLDRQVLRDQVCVSNESTQYSFTRPASISQETAPTMPLFS